ncbi:MAG: hypothetical protein EBU49_07545 [Proteobacteria bacterium]|nr:hypothetical protein [Pseudomonadota bacterium]
MPGKSEKKASTKIADMFDLDLNDNQYAREIIGGAAVPGDHCFGDVFIDFRTLDAGRLKNFHIPENFTVDGDMTLLHYPSESLPKNLTVTGNLIVTNSALKKLPKALNVGKVLDLTGNLFPLEIPDDLKYGTCLEMSPRESFPKRRR